jgi:hypothetical protein
MSDRDQTIAQAVEQLDGNGGNAAFTAELKAQAEAAYKDGISAEDLARAVHEKRIEAAGNSDPKTWPGVEHEQGIEARMNKPMDQAPAGPAGAAVVDTGVADNPATPENEATKAAQEATKTTETARRE